MTIIAILYKEI